MADNGQEKEGFWGKVKKRITKKVIITVACILAVVGICAFMYYNTVTVFDHLWKTVVNSANNVLLMFEDEDGEQVEVYTIDTSVGVDGCKLRPKTGVYPGTSGSSGVATSRGTLPEGVPTIREMLDFELKMYEHAKTKYSSITDKVGDKHSDGTGNAHIFSLLDKTNGASFIGLHNNKTHGHTDKSAGKHGQKLVKDSDYPYSYGTLDFNDNRQTFSDSGNGEAWKGCNKPAGEYMKESYDANISIKRTYGRYDSLSLGYSAGDVKKKWRDGGSKSSNGLAQFDCPDGVTRLGAVFKANIGYYLYGVPLSAGDYVDVYYEDGQVDHYIMQDSKGQETESFVMHPTGCCIEHYITKSVSSGNVLDILTDRKGVGVTGFVKVGNLLNDPNCTGTYTITWKDGQPGTGGLTVTPPSGGSGGTGPAIDTPADGSIPDGYAYLDSNGQPCVPDGAGGDGTGPTGGTGGWENKFGATTGRRTYKNFLATALSAQGHVLYVWGGGQGLDNYKQLHGIIPEWDTFYKSKHDAGSYAWSKSGNKAKTGMDCAGFVRWAVNNTMYSDPSQFQGFDTASTTSVKFQTNGWGVRTSANWLGGNVKPGDVISHSGHIWIVVGKCSDGSIVIVHSAAGDVGNPGGVHLSGNKGEAVKVAKEYGDRINTVMNEMYGTNPCPWYPSKEEYADFSRGGTTYNISGTHIFSWYTGSEGLEDPDGILSMDARQILELIIGDAKATVPETPAGDTSGSGKKKIYIDPGHGPGTATDAQMTAMGYSKDSNGKWGEWRHYDSTGKVGTNCKNCGKDKSHACWYPFANAIRPEHLEPVLTMGIANELAPILQARGYEVKVSRTSSEHPSIGKRAKDAYDFGAHIQVCIHTNAGGGSGMAYCSPVGGGYGPNSYKLSDWQSKSIDLNKKILDGIKAKSTLGLYNKGIINNYGYLILYEKASCPTAYLEIGFHDNSSDLAKIKAETKKIAEGIADGIDAYFK